MPHYEFPLPIGATQLKLVDRQGVEYHLDEDAVCFTREGEDGVIPILGLFGGDEFRGEVPEGQWRKNWDSSMNANQHFTAILNQATEELYFQGEADVEGTAGRGWLNSKSPLPMLDETEITVAMSVPVDQTAGASKDIFLDFGLKKNKNTGSLDAEANRFWVRLIVDENGLQIQIKKEIDGTVTTIASGYNYEMTAGKSTGDLEAIIMRMVFNGKPGTPNATVSMYMKQSDTIDNAESATEYELDGSPFDISDLLFYCAYPAFQLYSQNTTYFDAGGEAKVRYVRVSYPDFDIKYECTAANRLLANVELWDGDPAGSGVKVYDKDHVFQNSTAYLTNSLIRVEFEILASGGFRMQWYDPNGAAWGTYLNRTYAYISTVLNYPQILSIEYLSSEKITLKIKGYSSALDDSAYTIHLVTLRRGSLVAEYRVLTWYPFNRYVSHWLAPTTQARFGYAGDGVISDDDTDNDFYNNTLQDNWWEAFDDEGENKLIVKGSNKEPSAYFRCDNNNNLGFTSMTPDIREDLILYLGFCPFAEVANLFEEAEDAITDGDVVVDGDASGGEAVDLDAQNEYVYINLTAGTDLLEGRYIAFFRGKDTNQVADDVRMYVQNTTDSEYRDELSQYNLQTYTMTAAYDWYNLIFDIQKQDVDAGDNIRIRIEKELADANTISIDYFLIVPIGNGESYPQDVIHNMLRGANSRRKVFIR